MKFTVPLVPPSVNMYVRHTRKGRHYVSKEAKAFKEAVAIFGRNCRVDGEALQVEVQIFLGARQRGDTDNFSKCVLDGMVEAGIIGSDDSVTDLILRKRRDRDNPRTEIEVKAI